MWNPQRDNLDKHYAMCHLTLHNEWTDSDTVLAFGYIKLYPSFENTGAMPGGFIGRII